MEHYYSGEPTTLSQPRTVQIEARNVRVSLTTDSGVFSKRGLDYGTRVLIESVELPSGSCVVDLGCGYGPVTAVLSQICVDCTWVLLDVNERAVNLARANVERVTSGRTGNRVQAAVSDGFSAAPDLVADAVILNPPIRAGKKVVYRLFEEAHAHLRNGGQMWCVIHKKHGAASAKTFLETLFTNVQLAKRDAGYHVFCCTKNMI